MPETTSSRGHRYPLVIYRHMLNRWWPVSLTLCIVLFSVVAIMWFSEYYHINPAENPIPTLPTADGVILLGAGAFALIFTIMLLILRGAAYIQPFGNHLRLVTPFLRFNIAYRRIQRTYTAEIQSLFPANKISGWRRDMIAPLAKKTAIVIQLNGFPLSPLMMRMFLSPFFFKDRTPHIVILVKDWMRFSTELDSLKSSGQLMQSGKPRRGSGLLSNIVRKKS